MGVPLPDVVTVQWHARPAEEAVEALRSDPGGGLTHSEAAERLERIGRNVLFERHTESWWEEVLESLREPLQLLLLVVGGVYALLGEWEDAVTIILVILAVSASEVFSELRARRAIAALASLSRPSATVIRSGTPLEVPTPTVVPGDVILLAAGTRVPADLRLLVTAALRVDEASLTGESVPVAKDASAVLEAIAELGDRRTMAYTSTLVTAGNGRGLVVATGQRTEVGRIARMAQEAREPRTQMQQSMRELSGWLVWVAIALSTLIPVLGVLLAHRPWQQMLLVGLTLAFATIPEELPILITMVLGLGAYQLARQQAIVRRLRAAETLGSVTLVATDKTGTLTKNRMRLAEIVDAAGTFIVSGIPAETRLLTAAVLANDAQIARLDGRIQLIGDPTDTALLDAASAAGLDVEDVRRCAAVVGEFPFDDVRKRMSVVCAQPHGCLVAAKGAPESILDACGAVVSDSVELPLDGARRAQIQAVAEAMAARGLRVLACADRRLLAAAKASFEVEQVERDLTLIGLVGLDDPPRPEAREAVHALQRAGVRVLMLTGDHPAAAQAIAARVGIDGEQPRRGRDLEDLSDQDLAKLTRRTSVFARIAPEHKLRIVRVLQAAGEVVAVTGDGVNDAPALREAAIGVAMGRNGTDVAREAADLVLADDNFATVVAAVRTGRVLFANLRKAVRFYLAAKVALIAASLMAVMAQLPPPFEPVQIIVLELFMDLGASTTFVVEPAEEDVMAQPPRNPRRQFVDGPMRFGILAGGLSLGLAVLISYLAAWQAGADLAQAQTAAFVAWMIGHVVLAAHMRAERQPLLRTNMLANKTFLVWVAASVALVILGLSVPLIRERLHLALPPAGALAVAVAVAVLLPSWWEVWKWWSSRPSGR